MLTIKNINKNLQNEDSFLISTIVPFTWVAFPKSFYYSKPCHYVLLSCTQIQSSLDVRWDLTNGLIQSKSTYYSIKSKSPILMIRRVVYTTHLRLKLIIEFGIFFIMSWLLLGLKITTLVVAIITQWAYTNYTTSYWH